MHRKLYNFFTATENRRSTIIVVFSSFAAQAMLLVTGILVARALGPESRGELAFLLLVPNILILVGNLGIPSAMTYYIASGSAIHSLLKHITRLLVIAAPITVIVYLLIAYFISNTHGAYNFELAVLLSIFIPAAFLKLFTIHLFQGIGNFLKLSTISLSYVGYYAIGIIILAIFNSLSLANIVYTWIAVYFFTVIQCYYYLHNAELPAGPNKSPSYKSILSYAIRGHFGSISPLESLRADQLLAITLLDTRLLGLYVAAQAFTNLPFFLAKNISAVVFPGITKKSTTAEKKAIFLKSVSLMFAVSALLAILLSLAMPYLVILLFGKQFQESIILAQILILGSVFMSTRRVIVELLRGMGQPGVSTLSELVMYPWLIIGGSLLTVNYSGIGLAISVIIAYIVSLIIAVYYSARAFKSF